MTLLSERRTNADLSSIDSRRDRLTLGFQAPEEQSKTAQYLAVSRGRRGEVGPEITGGGIGSELG
jgi:hypothetical protein